jgi:hypothetical protein
MGVRADGGRMTSTRSVFDLYRQSIEISEEEFSSIIAKMARRRLVFSYAERQILSINDYDSIKLSWRAEYIFKNMKRYAPIGQAYLEDLEIADGDEENIDVKSGYSVRYQNDEAILSLINYCFEIELAQLEIIKENNSLDSYRSIYPAKPISDNIYLPLRKELKGVSETLAVQFSETRSSVREILGKSEGIAGLKKHEMSKLAFPRRLERGVQIVVDNVSDEERRRLYLELIKEAMETLSSGDGRKKSTVAKLKQKLSDLVKVGRDGEKVTEWGQELLEAFEPLIAAAPT